MVSAILRKKIKPSSPISFHSFGNLKKVCKKFFFHADAIAMAAYAEQLLPRGIVWTYLKDKKPGEWAIYNKVL